MLLFISIYVPPIQDAIFTKVTNYINKGDKLHIEYDKLRIGFPAHLKGNNISVNLPGEMEAQLDFIDADFKLIPLIRLNIATDRIVLNEASFKLENPDSTIYLKAAIDTLIVDNLDVKIKESDVSFSKGDIIGTNVTLLLQPDDTTHKETKNQSGNGFVIHADELNVHRINYLMKLDGVIDTLSASFQDLKLQRGLVNLNEKVVKASEFKVDGAIAKYIYDIADKKEKQGELNLDEKVKEEKDSLPWQISIDKIDFNAREALYAKKGETPAEYFSPEYIKCTDISLSVDSFYNAQQDIRVPINYLSISDFYGMRLNASGTFTIDNSIMKVEDFNVSLPGSKIDINALMGLASKRYPIKSELPIKLNLSANIAPYDISVFLPSMKEIINGLPGATPIIADIALNGTMDNITVSRLSIDLPRYLNLSADGFIAGFSSDKMKHLYSNLHFYGKLMNPNVIKPSLVESKLGKDIRIVPFNIRGGLNFRNGVGKTDIKIAALEGNIALDGKINFGREGYDIILDSRDFPVQAILPKSGFSNVSAKLQVNGNNFNPLQQNAELNANLIIDSVYFRDIKFHTVELSAQIQHQDANIRLLSAMKEADFSIIADGNINRPDYYWHFTGDIQHVDLEKLGFSKNANAGSLRLNGDIDVNIDSLYVASEFIFPKINWEIDGRPVTTKDLVVSFDADHSGTVCSVDDHDLAVELSSPESLDSILHNIPILKETIDSCIKRCDLNVYEIQSKLPKFKFIATAKKNNLISSWLQDRGEYFDSLGITIKNDSLITLDALIKNYNTPKYIVDSITADIKQIGDSLFYGFQLRNSPMSPGDWADVKLFGSLGGNEIDLRFNQKNYEDKTGFLLGFNAEIADSTIIVRFKPINPIIAYKLWSINPDNYISYNYGQKHFDANLMMNHDDSSIKLYTHHLHGSDEQEDINLILANIEIGEWMALNPFATPMKGILAGKLSLSHEGKVYTGDGNISLTDFYYGKQRVGTFDLGVDVSTTPHGFIHAGASVAVDSVEAIRIYGVLNDTTLQTPFLLKLDIDSLPLKIVNPFLVDAGVQLSGKLDGSMNITGDPSSPVFNGYIDFDNAGVKVNMLGTTYMLSNKTIPVDTGLVKFQQFDIMAVNDNPLIIDGTVNMRDILNPVVDLSLNAKNTQLVGTDRARGGADIYGKAFIDLNAEVKGDFNYMNVSVDVDILNTTNVTYVMAGGAGSALSSRSNSDIVKFVNFADTAMVAGADSIRIKGLLLNVNAFLNISRGAVIAVDLSADGKNKVQLEPVGSLDFSMDVLRSQHLTGRITLDGGFARYTPPLMSEKLFTISDGSYIDFNGNISNPILNIHAVDRMRANVTQEGQNSRLIYFNVLLDITGTLENMDVAFNLSTDDDLTVENELESMSPSQRASKAMNLLLTNIYNGPGTSADANLGANALYSFLGSTLNSWAANNIRAVDLSFGVNQYDNTTNGITSQATSYSYNVSKSLFDDRFKINIGGNYTTDADADENFAENLISDVSVEYMLNPNGSMYLKIFRHAGFESILEGEIVQTGVGFTYRKRMNSLRQMFRFILPKKYQYNARVKEEEEKYLRKLDKSNVVNE